MIIYKQGNLLDNHCNVIAHGCNCMNTMNSGVARAIRERYPEAYEADCQTVGGNKSKLGTFSKALVDNRARMVYNLYQQYGYGRDRVYLDYAALEVALKAMREDLLSLGIFHTCKIGMPKIGAGLAGGDWQMVSNIIDTVFDDKAVWVYVL